MSNRLNSDKEKLFSGAIGGGKSQYNEESSNINLTCSTVSIMANYVVEKKMLLMVWWRRSCMVHNVKFKNTYGDALFYCKM